MILGFSVGSISKSSSSDSPAEMSKFFLGVVMDQLFLPHTVYFCGYCSEDIHEVFMFYSCSFPE